jgi:hypothetical protein
MILLAAAEILAPKSALWMFQVINAIGLTSIPVVLRLMVLAKRAGVYEEYMVYPNSGEVE